MSKMTSSMHSQAKPLTNFSIESLIGGQVAIKPQHQHPQQHAIKSRAPKMERQKDLLLPTVTPSTNQNPSHKKYRPKNFQCPACKMAFSNNGQLKNHVRIHTGERPFRCNHLDCNKTFTRNEELTRHKLIHTGVRPHSCTTCGKSFGRKDHLKKHVKTHEKKRIRKKVYVPASSAFNQETNPIFVPPIKPAKISDGPMQRLLEMHPSTSDLSLTQINCSQPMNRGPMLDPHGLTSSLATTFSRLPQTFNTGATSTTVQQLAHDYWSQWYNLLGIYQHYQPPPATDRLSEMFRNT